MTMTPEAPSGARGSASGAVEFEAAGAAGRALRRMLLSDEVIDGLLGEVGPDGLRLTGDGGFLPQLIKAVLERGLAVELTDHLGYDKGRPGRARGAQLPQREHAQDAGHRGRPGAAGGAPRPGRHVRCGPGPQGAPRGSAGASTRRSSRCTPAG